MSEPAHGLRGVLISPRWRSGLVRLHHGTLTTCAYFSTLPAASSPCAETRGALSMAISHSAKFGRVAFAAMPLTTTLVTVPLSDVTPRTSSLPSFLLTDVIIVVGARSST